MKSYWLHQKDHENDFRAYCYNPVDTEDMMSTMRLNQLQLAQIKA